MDNGKVVLSVLAGIAVGAVLGILFAPDKGSETRKKIAGKGADLVDGVKEKLNDLVSGATEKFEEVKDKAAKMYDRGSNHASMETKKTSKEMS